MDAPIFRPTGNQTSLPKAATLFDHMADAVYLIDPDSSDIVWANRAAWSTLGLERDDVLNHSVLSLQVDVTGQPHWSEIAKVIRGGECFTFVGRHRHNDGHELAVEVNTTHFELDGREYFLSVARDITRRLALENDLKDRESRLWFALNEAADGLWDWEMPTGHLYFSPQLKRMLGYGPDEMTPVLETWSQNVHPDDQARVQAILQEHIDGKRVRYEAEYRLRNRNGHYLWVHDRGRICERDERGHPTRVVGMVQDITERKLLEFRLQELASSDMLTGLPNRRQGSSFLENQLELYRRMSVPLGLCFFDIDHFKSINDRFGHPAGDQVLRYVAEQARQALRRSDMLCRWGGEEFLIISPNLTAEQMQLVADKVRQAITRQAGLAAPAVTISLGIACFPEHGRELSDLLAKADAALYRAKSQGRNRVEIAG